MIEIFKKILISIYVILIITFFASSITFPVLAIKYGENNYYVEISYWIWISLLIFFSSILILYFLGVVFYCIWG